MARLKDRDPQSVQINSLTSSPITTTPSTSITTSPIIQSIQDRKWFERGKWSCQDINMSKSDILNKADQKNNSTKTNIDRTPFQPCLSQRNMTQSFGYLGVGESMADINFDLNKGNSMTSLDFNSSTNNGSCSGCVIGDGNGMSSNGNSGDCDGAGCNSNSNGGNSIGNGSELVKPKGIPLLKVGTKKMSVGRGLTISQDVFRVRVWMKQSNTFEYNMV